MEPTASRVKDMQHHLNVILDSMADTIDGLRQATWPPKEGLLPIILRSLVIRQFDTLRVMSSLVSDGLGYATGPMLRPSCEERIWSKYLLDMDRKSANILLLAMSQQEIGESLQAQDEIAGRTITKKLGLMPHLKRTKRSRERVSGQLRNLATHLEWPKQSRKNGALPSIRWIAERVDLLPVYNLIYHATSRFVHFRVHELMRNVWGNAESGPMLIRPTHMEPYRSHFSLYWGLSLFLETTIPILEFTKDFLEFEDGDGNHAEILTAAKGISELGRVPIITSIELAWPDNP